MSPADDQTAAILPRAEHFPHGADIGVRGVGPSLESAFEQAALALTGIVTEPARIEPLQTVRIDCAAPDLRLLLADWLNAVIYHMAVDHLLFGRFSVAIEGTQLEGWAWGEPVDPARHAPAVEPKGATYTALAVEPNPAGGWTAQCVVDV